MSATGPNASPANAHHSSTQNHESPSGTCATRGTQTDDATEVKDRIYFHVSDITRENSPANGVATKNIWPDGTANSLQHHRHDFLNQDANAHGLANMDFWLQLRSPSKKRNMPLWYQRTEACSEECRRCRNGSANSSREQVQTQQEGGGSPKALTLAARKKFLVLDLNGAGWESKISQRFRSEVQRECSFVGLCPNTDQLRNMPYNERIGTMVLINGDSLPFMQQTNRRLRDDLVRFAHNGGSVMFLSGFVSDSTIIAERFHPIWRSFGLPWCSVPGYYRTPVGPLQLPDGRTVDGGERLLHGMALHQVPEEHKDLTYRFLSEGWQNTDLVPAGFRDQDVMHSGPVPFALACVGMGWVGYYGMDSGYAWEDEMYLTIRRLCGLSEC